MSARYSTRANSKARGPLGSSMRSVECTRKTAERCGMSKRSASNCPHWLASIETSGAWRPDLRRRPLADYDKRYAHPDVLAKVCGIDLSEQFIPDGAAFRSSVARVATDVIYQSYDRQRSYILHCERSSGQYLFDAVVDAGTEFGIEVDGFGSRVS